MHLNQIPALVVDDSLDSRIILSKFLEKRGYSPRCVSDGQEALEIFENSLSDIQLLITDNNMSNLSGVDLIRKRMHSGMWINRVILFSGSDPNSDQIKDLMNEAAERGYPVFFAQKEMGIVQMVDDFVPNYCSEENSNEFDYFVLSGENPQQTHSYSEWLAWMNSTANDFMIEAQPERGVLVITRFEGRCLKGDKAVFNSVVIGGEFCGRTYKYETKPEALRGHQRVLALIKLEQERHSAKPCQKLEEEPGRVTF